MAAPVQALIAGEAALYAAVAALAAVLLMLRRRLRGFTPRMAPAGALTTSGGPPRGAALGALDATTLDGTTRALGSFGGRLLLLFVSDACPISRKLIPIARAVAKAEGLTLVFAGDEEVSRQRRFAARIGEPESRFINDSGPGNSGLGDSGLGRTLGVDKLPYAFLLDDDGRLVARGLVNSREHLESLVISGELGIASLQSWLATRPGLSAA